MRRPLLFFLLLLALVALLWFLNRSVESESTPPLVTTTLPTPEPAPEANTPTQLPAPSEKVERAVVESGVTIRLVRRTRIAPPLGALAASYVKLESEARSGNAVSQYRLGLLLYECHDVPAENSALTREVETIHQTRRRAGWDIATPDEEERALRQRYANCDGVPAAERGKFRDYLKTAADAGVLEAQLNLPLKLPDADYCQFLSECAPAQRAQQEALQNEAVDYIGRARDAGSASALWTFGAWYAEGEVLPRNEVEAYAHFRALDQINAASKEPQRFERMLAGMKRRLRPVDLDQAEARAKELLSNPNCCVITP